MNPPRPIRVLFLCIGNMCRSPMAEGFARSIGGASLEVWSAGFAPSGRVSALAIDVMRERGIDISSQHSKGIDEVPVAEMDWIISLGEVSARVAAGPQFAGRLEDWHVRDPIGDTEEIYREVRDDIERQVRAWVSSLGDG